MPKLFKIGELSELGGCPIETIRYYEREGLLAKAGRSAGNYRLYEKHHLDALQFIRNCRTLDMTLEEIRALLSLRSDPSRACTDVNRLLDEHIEHVRDRISELKKLDRTLRSLRAKCQHVLSVENCEILKGIGHLNPKTIEKSAQRAHSHARRGS
ncbi:Cd(II)/Pb(II)-responsive transcriptional regulator [Steroidobacter sp.]|uniref:Cd(II)/Pb(II)-responsive transcriptional regulator n=1 Tax=Steroidobacter sp. TaxID=1978227 RepID=UPI001A4FBC8F|nr:Cd(II)/Pb(II)-responsive transcriptional regulator [Steroidobacter sp.]MBL8269766.1 Cd(II)/Pb(II)-responsive transcriptional regulator [Steroidobacter sp.]